MEREKALEIVNELNRVKDSVSKLDEEIIKYQNATLTLKDSASVFNNLANDIKEILNKAEEINGQIIKITSDEVMAAFKIHVDSITTKVNDFGKYSQTFIEETEELNKFKNDIIKAIDEIKTLLYEKMAHLTVEFQKQKEEIKDQLALFSKEFIEVNKELNSINNIINENDIKNKKRINAIFGFMVIIFIISLINLFI